MLDAIYSRRDPLAAAPIRVAVVVSVFVHAALILELPQTRPPLPDFSERSEPERRLTVRLAPPFIVPPAAPPALPPVPRVQLRPPPPAVVPEQPAPGPASPPITPRAATPAPPVIFGDLSSYIESRRRARVAAAAPEVVAEAPQAESDNARATRLAAANLASSQTLTFGFDPTKSGGVFQIEHLAYDHAEFTFIGWNNDARRRTQQLIEVRKGASGDIRLAVVRRMIAIIRQHEPETFVWNSQRLGRSMTLSSRQRDNAGLEDFMMKEFFEESR